jgi:hypothetical protein
MISTRSSFKNSVHFKGNIYIDRDNIEGCMVHEIVLLESDLTIKSALQWIYVVYDNIENYIRND